MQVHRATALSCFEIGGLNSIEPLVLGAEIGLPVVDADGMGRAFPEVQMYLPYVMGHEACPSAIVNERVGNTVFSSAAKPSSRSHYEGFFFFAVKVPKEALWEHVHDWQQCNRG